MIRILKTRLIAWRFRHFTRHIDRQIAGARRSHAPVKHLQAAKSAFVHAALEGAVRR